MIVWVNGTFGVGKTTTSREVCSLLESARVWLAREAEVIDTAAVPAPEVAGEIVARLGRAHR